MSKTVLLARPHPFIVKEMKPFLEQNGYKIVKPDSITDLARQARQAQAAVISLAVVSEFSTSAEEVLTEIRKVNPSMPIILASLLSLDKVSSAITRILNSQDLQAQIVGASSTINSGGLTAKDYIVYLAKDDLTLPSAREKVKQLLSRFIK